VRFTFTAAVATMKTPSDIPTSLLRRNAAVALRGARKLPGGDQRNNLRQLAMGLLWLEKKRLKAPAQARETALAGMIDSQK
jgi:hypothetical protein